MLSLEVATSWDDVLGVFLNAGLLTAGEFDGCSVGVVWKGVGLRAVFWPSTLTEMLREFT